MNGIKQNIFEKFDGLYEKGILLSFYVFSNHKRGLIEILEQKARY